MTDLRQDYIRTMISCTDRIRPQDVAGIFVEMEAQAIRDLADQQVSPGDMAFQRFADMRYQGQEHTVKVPLPSGAITATERPEIVERFHRLHEAAYSFRLDAPVEMVNYHLTALGRVAKPEFRPVNSIRRDLRQARKGVRRVNFDELGFHEAEIYERSLLPVGVDLQGPVVIEEPASTTVVFPGQRLMRDRFGLLHIEE
jgi:N-methylhydantoinase A